MTKTVRYMFASGFHGLLLTQHQPEGQRHPHLHPIPFRDLPEQYVPSLKYRNPPVLHYGIPMFTKSLDKYAVRSGRVSPERLRPVTAIPVTLIGLAEIRKACSPGLYFEVPIFPYSPEHDMILALYANYDMHERRQDEATEAAIFQQVKEELQLPQDLPAMWFHSVERRWEDTETHQLDWNEVMELTAGWRPEDDPEWEPFDYGSG